MLANNAEMTAGSPPLGRGKARLLTLDAIDGRTIAARRARELARGFEAELGGSLSVSRRLAVERAAALVAIAEDAQARRLASDPAVSLEDLVRIDNTAVRAVRLLGLKPTPAASTPPSLAAWAQQAAPPRPQGGRRDEGGEAVTGNPKTEPLSGDS
jgi:thioesterase domain-containing protein